MYRQLAFSRGADAITHKVSAPRKTPRQQRSRDTFERILDAAARIFDERGYAGATTNHVAAAAGISIGSLYQYFPNKDAILYALAQRHLAASASVVATAVAATDERAGPEEVVRNVIDAVVDLHRVSPRTHHLLFERIPQSPELRRLFAEAEAGTVALVEAGLLRFFVDAATARRRAPVVVCAVEAVVHRMVLDDLVAEDGAGRDSGSAVDEMVAMVLAYVQAPAAGARGGTRTHTPEGTGS